MRLKLFMLAALWTAACPKPSSPKVRSTETKGPVVATYGEHALTLSELQRIFNDQSPFVRAHYTSMDKKKEFLEAIIQNDLLADQATKDGFDKDDEVIEESKKALIQEWTKEKFNEKEGVKTIPEAAIRDFYDAHHADYQRPERLRVQIVLFASAAGGDAKAKSDAEQARKALVAKKDLAAFAELARLRSDDPVSKMRGGDLDFHSQDELAKSYGDEVGKAAFGLKVPDDVSAVVKGNQGFYLVRLEARQPPYNRTLEQVEPVIRLRLWNERRAKIYDDYLKGLVDSAHIKVDDAVLAKLDPNQPAALSDEPPTRPATPSPSNPAQP